MPNEVNLIVHHASACVIRQYSTKSYNIIWIYFAAKADRVKNSINGHFWRADLGYYVTNEVFDNLSSSGNLLVVSRGLTAPKYAQAITIFFKRKGGGHPATDKIFG